MNGDRVILHCDLNNFYASVECIGRPDLKKRPVAVCGDPERRHGIVLAKNDVAKKLGVKTGEPLCSARAKCPQILFLPAHFDLYMHYSGAMRDLYRRYTDKIEAFGVDECWLDVTESRLLFGDGEKIANELRESAKNELGLTISAGVSFNKIFAKMGSDYKKPDATTVISRGNYRELLWPLPVEDMMFVGASSARKLRLFGISTVGELANMPLETLKKYFGRPGLQLRAYANGIDPSPVAPDSYRRPPESVGNSVTCPRDLVCDDDVRTVLYMLCDSVASRLRGHGMKCRSLSVYLKNSDFEGRSRRKALEEDTKLTTVLYAAALALYREMKIDGERIRSVGVCAEKLSPEVSMQISFFDGSYETARRERLEETVDELRARFGRRIVKGAVALTNPDLTAEDPGEQKLRPFSARYLGGMKKM